MVGERDVEWQRAGLASARNSLVVLHLPPSRGSCSVVMARLFGAHGSFSVEPTMPVRAAGQIEREYTVF